MSVTNMMNQCHLNAEAKLLQKVIPESLWVNHAAFIVQDFFQRNKDYLNKCI